MKSTKIFLSIILIIFFFGFISNAVKASPISVSDSVTVTVTGTWVYEKDCPSAPGSLSIEQTQVCTGGNGTCTGSASTRTCPAIVCHAPLTQTVKVACDVNSNGDAATGGQVTRSQTKSAYPVCLFDSPVTNANSTYVSDNCVYPVPSMGSKVNGGWSIWSPERSDVCGDSGTQTRSCTNPAPANGGAYCPSDIDGLAVSKDYTNDQCAIFSNLSVTSGGVALDGGKLPYNSLIRIDWTTDNTTSCNCSSDSTSLKNGCPGFSNDVSGSYTPPPLKKDITFTLSCSGSVFGSASKIIKVPIAPINTKYIEQ